MLYLLIFTLLSLYMRIDIIHVGLHNAVIMLSKLNLYSNYTNGL